MLVAVLPSGLIAAGCDPWLAAAYGVMVNGQEQVPLHAHQHYGISPAVGNHLYNKVLMAEVSPDETWDVLVLLLQSDIL